MKHANVIILLAERFKTLYETKYSDVKTPAIVLYNSCDNVNAIPYEQHNKTILFAGAFRPNKGGSTLIKAFANVHKNYPEWRLCLLGTGEEKNIYEQLALHLGIEEKVEMPGYITGSQLCRYFQEAGIYCLCSHHEGFPMVVLEAWGYGVPVICTPVGGLPDVIKENDNALTYEFGEVEQLTQKLSALMSDDKKRCHMSEYSRKFVYEHFHINKINTDIDKLYSNI